MAQIKASCQLQTGTPVLAARLRVLGSRAPARASNRLAPLTRSARRVVCEAAVSKERQLVLRGKDPKGGKDWDGLLPTPDNDTLDPELRSLVVMLGEMAQVTYDSFVGDASSRLFGKNRFDNPAELLEGSLAKGSAARRYRIGADGMGQEELVKRFYMYATEGAYKLSEDSKEGNPSPDEIEDEKNKNWIGYIAVSQPEDGVRDIAIVFRGTITGGEWKTNLLGDKLEEWDPRDPSLGKVHDGFRATYWETGDSDLDSPRATVRLALEGLLAAYGEEIRSVTVTGHSLGGALATLAAFDVGLRLKDQSEKGIRKTLEKQGVKIYKDIHVSAITWASPRVGNPDFKDAMKRTGVKVLRVVNPADVVPMVPGLASTALTRQLYKIGINTRAPGPGSVVGAALSGLNYVISKVPFVGNWSYQHTAPEWYVNIADVMYQPGASKQANKKRPLRPMGGKDVGSKHNLEVYLYLASHLSAQKGGALDRDPVMVNKSDFCLEPKWLLENGYPDIPKCWYNPMGYAFYSEWKKTN